MLNQFLCPIINQSLCLFHTDEIRPCILKKKTSATCERQGSKTSAVFIVHILWIKHVPLVLIHVNTWIFLLKKWHDISDPISHRLRSKSPLPLRFQTALRRFLGTSPRQQRCCFLVTGKKQDCVQQQDSRYRRNVVMTALSFQL